MVRSYQGLIWAVNLVRYLKFVAQRHHDEEEERFNVPIPIKYRAWFNILLEDSSPILASIAALVFSKHVIWSSNDNRWICKMHKRFH